MKRFRKLLSVLISLCIIAASFAAFGMTANAKSKYNAQKQQYNSQFSSVNFCGNQFAFVFYNEGEYELCYTPKYGGYDIPVYKTENYISSVSIKGKFVYFVDYTDGAICRIRKDGTGLKKLVSIDNAEQSINYIISGKRLIYHIFEVDFGTYETTRSDIYTCTLAGKNKTRIVKNADLSSEFTYGNKLYYLKKSRVYSFSFKTNKSTLVKRIPSGSYLNGMDGNILYYIGYGDSTDSGETVNCYKLNVSTKKKSKIGTVKCDGTSVHSMITTDDKVFVVTGTGAGDAFAQLRKGKLDYKSFESKYDMCADYMGYFKNKILIQNTDDNYAFLGVVEVATVK